MLRVVPVSTFAQQKLRLAQPCKASYWGGADAPQDYVVTYYVLRYHKVKTKPESIRPSMGEHNNIKNSVPKVANVAPPPSKLYLFIILYLIENIL